MRVIFHKLINKIIVFSSSLKIFFISKNNIYFIFLHDKKLIEKCKRDSIINKLNPKYVFLGIGDVETISNDVIISRFLKKNIEQHKYFTAFTGWYSLWKNKYINSKYITLLEYDVILSERFDEEINKFIRTRSEIISFLPLSTRDENFIENELWVKEIFKAIYSVYGIDLKSYIHTLSRNNKDMMWASTSNTTFRYDVFIEYMLWFEPLIPYLKESKYSGHAFERSISFYSILYNKKITFIKDILEHFNLDSHSTQGNKVL